MHFFVDLQGFKCENNRFIVKEICLISNTDETEHLYIVKPPFHYNKLPLTYKKQARWLSNNFHGFDWKDGFISFRKAKNLLLSVLPKSGAIILVKGEEKKKWIDKILKCRVVCDFVIYNIEDLGYNYVYTEDSNNVHCKYHSEAFICAYQNARNIKQWFVKNFEE